MQALAPANTTENTLGTYTIPGGTMGTNSSIRITALFSYTNSANTKTVKINFGATNLVNQNVTTTTGLAIQRTISNRNSLISQVSFSDTTNTFATGGNPLKTPAENTANPVTITITGQKASAGEVLGLEQFIVELLP